MVELPSRLEVMEDKDVPYIAFQPEAPLDHESDRGDEGSKPPAHEKLGMGMGKKMTFKHQLSKKNTNFMMRTGTVMSGELAGRSEPQSDESDEDDDQMDDESSVASLELELDQLKSLNAPDLELGV